MLAWRESSCRQLGGGRDRIAGQHQRELAAHAGGDQPQRQRGGAVDVAVGARRNVGGRRDAVLDVEQLGGLAERPAGVEGGQVGLGRRRVAGELLLHPALGDVGGTSVEPRDDAEREQVLGPAGVAGGDALHPFDRARGQRAHGDAVDAVFAQRAVLERIVLVARLLQVALGEGVLVDDDRGAALQLGLVGLERRGVHRHQDIGVIARREDVARGEVDLEGRDAGQRSRRRPDLGREVRQRGQVVADDRGGVREPATGQLHSVAGVPGEADDDAFELLDLLGHRAPSGRVRVTCVIPSSQKADSTHSPGRAPRQPARSSHDDPAPRLVCGLTRVVSFRA